MAWNIEINVAAVRRVRDLCKVDLMAILDVGGDLFMRLESDPVLLVDVLCVLCMQQLDEKKLTQEDFGRRLAGDAIDSATTAFLEELVSFFPARRRTVLAAMLKKANQIAEQMTRRIVTDLEKPETERDILERMRQEKPGEPSTSAPAS
jgi:hypothetical protein